MAPAELCLSETHLVGVVESKVVLHALVSCSTYYSIEEEKEEGGLFY